MKISIIIPTYNEEEYRPVLLDSIKEQSFTDYEVIVADANACRSHISPACFVTIYSVRVFFRQIQQNLIRIYDVR